MDIKKVLFKLDETCAKRRPIGVQPVFLALKDKMKLKRCKDKTYSYNHKFLKKFSINMDNRMNRIENVIADAFERSGMAEYARNNKEAADKLQSAMIIAAKELVKQFGL